MTALGRFFAWQDALGEERIANEVMLKLGFEYRVEP